MTVGLEIHPSIGICRVGTSDQFFLGPEPGVGPPPTYRDERGNLLRQAARFRVFECERDDAGRLLRFDEIGPDRGRIDWTIHVANRKGDGELHPVPPSRRPQPGARRNAGRADRSSLVIDPGPRRLSEPGSAATFDGGRFLGVEVPLGQARVDDEGRLLVVGGFGRSDGPAEDLKEFSNNDNWSDDVSDGPVTASVELSGGSQPIHAAAAWLIVAPPDFAPRITNFVTLYDVAFQAAVERGWLAVPETVSFARDILPILSRAVGYSWVLELARDGHGAGRRGDFTAESRLARLADPATPKVLREAVIERLRDPSDVAPQEPGLMPRLSDETNTLDALAPTKSQYAVLRSWVEGAFVDDRGKPHAAEPLPDALDRLALEACAGGPFFPGIEAGPIMAQATRYSGPFRLDQTQLRPGQVTQGNAVPWQADFLLCRFDDHRQLGWWPAQRPDKVLVDAASGRIERWQRGVQKFADMVEHWHRLGVVVPASGPDGKAVFVESERTLPDT